MPENEFELYLSLLSRFLRLKPAQHGEIADELRDHLEARLEELTERGLSRNEAIRQALDEFGDAAELAKHFTQLAHVRRRRLIMRFTFGTVAALAASLLVATAFWPETNQAPISHRAFAQFAGGSGAAGGSAGPGALQPGAAAIAADDADKRTIDAKLNKQIGKVEFTDLPLRDVLTYLSDAIEVDILIDRAGISEAGVSEDISVTLQVKHANLTARVALDFVLEWLKLSYTVRDGLIVVTTAEHANQILVYNVRDLVNSNPGSGGNAGDMNAGAGPTMMGMPGGSSKKGRGMAGGMNMPPMGGMPGMGGPGAGATAGGGLGGGGFGLVVRETNSLADLIAITIDPATWERSGGHGSIVQYRDLLIVKNSQTVHGKIKVLLDMLRTSAAAGVPATGGAGI